MAENDRVQAALAEYLEFLEIGGSEPDTSHLSEQEKGQLRELIDALELTEGVSLGRGLEESEEDQSLSPSTDEGTRLFAELRARLTPEVRVEVDENRLVGEIGGLAILDRLIVGTFGGRVRVWLLDVDTAEMIERNTDCIPDLARVFRMFPDMSAVALVARDHSSLIVEPQDCAPQIQVPSGSLTSRRFRRAIGPVDDSLSTFIDDLSPYWDPMPAFESGTGIHIDIEDIGARRVRAAVERQRGMGERARKGNPKKDALLAFGDGEISNIEALAKGIFDGSVDPVEIEERIDRLVEER